MTFLQSDSSSQEKHLRVTKPQGRDSPAIPRGMAGPSQSHQKLHRELRTEVTERKKQAYSSCEVLRVMREANMSYGTMRELELFAAGLKGNGIEDVNTSISKTSGQEIT